jgi:hypothetical protein
MRVFANRLVLLGALVGLFMMSPDAGIAALVCGFGYVAARRHNFVRALRVRPNSQFSNLSEV